MTWLADLILRIFGEEPAAYPHIDDKWAAVLGDLTYYFVPYGMIIAFLVPFLFFFFRKDKISRRNTIILGAVGMILAVAIYFLDQWFLVYGQASLFYDIYGR